MAVITCYPDITENTLIGSKTILYEIDSAPQKYPLYSEIKTNRHKKKVITHNCVEDLKMELRSKSRGSSHNGAVYLRRSL